MPKREDYISWDEYFMGLAIMASNRSKDPNTQVGACIVDDENNILSLGYNGTPNGYSDDEFPWERIGEDVTTTKYAYVCHSELNAILNASRQGIKLKDSILYVTLFPCNECAKALVQAGIKKVIYLDDKYHDTQLSAVSRKILTTTNVKFEKYNCSGREIKIKL
jgi:dCMP deaminase